jgi:hypothetical protein
VCQTKIKKAGGTSSKNSGPKSFLPPSKPPPSGFQLAFLIYFVGFSEPGNFLSVTRARFDIKLFKGINDNLNKTADIT